MFCPKCGDKVEQNEFYCNKCGKFLGDDKLNIQRQSCKRFSFYNKKAQIILGVFIGFGIFILFFVSSFVIKSFKERYYFSSTDYNDQTKVDSSIRKENYKTVIVTDNIYSGVKISTIDDALSLIVKDSVSQKDSCPSEIKTIENEIINKYGITAVNLCEVDSKFAKEISNVFRKIYNEYPSVRGYLTNLTLNNASLSDGYVAAFMPVFTFATSDSSSTYPWVIKTQILLNSLYFLNESRLELTVKDGSSSGHFPPNATMYSPIAHELGHYLSFLAMMKYYKLDSILMIDDNNDEKFYDIYNDFTEGTHSFMMITEAYNKYKSEVGTTLDIDTWRGQISNYALAKDKNGEYIYDETIAEAFHDVYLNGDNANLVSKYVTNVLKSKLEG